MLSKPTICFTIPSQHDGLTLKCRIYHPSCLESTSSERSTKWRRKAAIVAHPYAALGGSMDDHVVDLIASVCLREGFIVGVFNFRGAAGSEGRTSWQSKSEQGDYMSFISFMIYYLYHLSSSLANRNGLCRSDSELHCLNSFQPQYLENNSSQSPRKAEYDDLLDIQPRLLLSGYSYGALITMSLPATIQSIIASSKTPMAEPFFYEIRRRAEFYANQQIRIINSNKTNIGENVLALKSRSTGELPVVEGGNLRLDHGSHPTPSNGTKSVELSIKNFGLEASPKSLSTSPGTTNSHSSLTGASKSEGTQGATKTIGEDLQIAYLLVSPLHGIISDLLTVWTSSTWKYHNSFSEKDKKLQLCPTLAIYGDKDVFVGANNLRSWAKDLSDNRADENRSHFRHKQIKGAGHFWHDRPSIEILQAEMRNFVNGL